MKFRFLNIVFFDLEEGIKIHWQSGWFLYGRDYHNLKEVNI